MTHQLRSQAGDACADRDDRTRCALELLVGADIADISLTHFSAGLVEVHASEATLKMQSGFLAVAATLNMLSRFVGAVELHVADLVDASTRRAIEMELLRLRRIDTRPGRSVLLVGADAGVLVEERRETAARVWVGEPGSIDDRMFDAVRDIGIAFDGWTCQLTRGGLAGPATPSSTPFGALSAACFAVAEVFKSLVVDSVPITKRSKLQRRLTHTWRFSAWAMERMTSESSGASIAAPIPLDAVLQVGAGAVGNAAILAFGAMTPLSGDLRVLDIKTVDSTNLNRCFYFSEDHIGLSKVAVLEVSASRSGLCVTGLNELFRTEHASAAAVVLSTVDNNEVRHRMQEALPEAIVEGATGGTTVSVSVHRAGNGRSCLVCRHPDPTIGVSRQQPLSLSEAAQATGLTEEELTLGQVGGDVAITDDILARVAVRSEEAASALRSARTAGHDLCGALGDLRTVLGTAVGPREASVPFVSNLAGILAAAEVVKLLLRSAGEADVPVLDNVLQIDLAMDYSRHNRLSFSEPPRSDCALCQQRANLVLQVAANRSLSAAR